MTITQEMIEAGQAALSDHTDKYMDGSEVVQGGAVEAVYEAMKALAPTAPVEASGSEREHGPKCWGKTSISDEMMYCYCGSTDSPPGETREYPWSFYDALKVAGIEHASFCVNGVTVFGDRSAAKEAERWHHESVSVETYWRPEVIRQRDLLSALALGGQKGDSETLRVLLDNLVIAQTLSKDIRQKATDEARSYLYDLRHTPQPSGETREAWTESFIADEEEGPVAGICIDLPDGSQIWSGECSKTLLDEASARDESPDESGQFLMVALKGAATRVVAQVSTVDDGVALARAYAALLSARPLASKSQHSDGVGLEVWYGSMPESNGKANWTATLRRVNPTDKWDQGFCFARSEYPERVRYEADRMRWLIGEITDKPDILAYDADAHSGYVAPDTTPARAEAQDEGAAGEPVAWTGSGSLARIKVGGEGYIQGAKADAHPIPLYTHPSPPPAADEDRARSALTDLITWFDKPVQGERGMVWVIRAGDQGADDAVAEARAALKLEGRS